MIKVNADLFRIATLCQSKDATRLYLQGVYLEPHAVKGVTLTATDGHRLISIWDENGEANESAIISLSPNCLKECKSKKDKRILQVIGGMASVHETDMNGEVRVDMIAVSPNCRVDGVFPDYRRVVPNIEAYDNEERAPHFDGRILGALCDVALELAKEQGRVAKETGHNSVGESKPLIRVHGDWTSPAIVLFANDERAFGVVMPCRHPSKALAMPSWFGATKESSVAA